MVPQIRQLLEVVGTGVSDRETIGELFRVIDDRRRWKEGHDLFSRIRNKTLRADKNGDGKQIAQYCFEEVCAKSIYNESGPDDTFDSDSPFRVVPLALHAARKLGIDRERVLAVVAG